MEAEIQANSVQKNLIESALFISTKPLHIEELMRITGIGSLGYLKDIIHEVQKDYFEKGIEVVETPEGWQMQVKKEYLPRVSNLTPHSDLSEGHKKTLALVIYKEPLKQSELVRMQGTKAYLYVKELTKKGLLKAERTGHTKILKVTSEFESYFGDSKDAIRERIINSIEGDALPENNSKNRKAKKEEPEIVIEEAKPKHEIVLGDKKIETTEDDEFLDTKFLEANNTAAKEPKADKNLKPIKRARPVKVKIKEEKAPKEPKQSAPKNQPKPPQLTGLKELTVDDLKK